MPAIQLRFQVPPIARAAVRRAVTARPVRRSTAPGAWPIGVDGQLQRAERLLGDGPSAMRLALEDGVLTVDGAAHTVCDLVLEQQQGQLEGLIDLAARWVQRHGLWLEVRGHGDRAAHWLPQKGGSSPAGASAPKLRRSMNSDAALRALVAHCLEQALPHAATVASAPGSPESLHQARIGLRRLRAVLRTFGAWSAAVDPSWLVALGPLFEQLGRARDHDTVASLQPQIVAAGAPPYALPPAAEGADASATLRSRPFTLLMLRLIGFAYGAVRTDMASRGKLHKRARQRIARLHRRVWLDAGLYAGLDDTQRHRVRKRIKRLRYCLEETRALFPKHELQSYLQQLRRAQDALGAYNDLLVARSRFDEWVRHDARMWFALGWLGARREQMLRDVSSVLKQIPRSTAFLETH